MFGGVMADTWIVATMVAAVAGCVGFFVVLRGASFEAHSLPLGAFPGAAAASLLGVDEYAGLLVAAGLGAVGIAAFARRDAHQVATALVLILMLGLGALLLSRTGGYAPSVFSLLFGAVLGVGRAAVGPVALLSAAALLATALLWRPLLLDALAPDLGTARGVRAGAIEFLFLAVLALATATALPVVGALLVFSLTVGPPSAALAIAGRPGRAMALSIAFALLTTWSAIALSYASDWPVGFFIGSGGALLYAAGRLWPRRRAPAAGAEAGG